MSGRTGEYDIAAPASLPVAVTPDDANDLPSGISRAIYVGVAGNINLTLARASGPVLFQNMPVGVHPLRVRRVHSAGTTAGGIVALY